MKPTPTQLRWITDLHQDHATPPSLASRLWRSRRYYLMLGLFAIFLISTASTIDVYFLWAAVGYVLGLFLQSFAEIYRDFVNWPVQADIIDWQRVDEVLNQTELPPHSVESDSNA